MYLLCPFSKALLPTSGCRLFVLTPISRRTHQRGSAHTLEAVVKCIPSDTFIVFQCSSRKQFHVSRQDLCPQEEEGRGSRNNLWTESCEAAELGVGPRPRQDGDERWVGRRSGRPAVI